MGTVGKRRRSRKNPPLWFSYKLIRLAGLDIVGVDRFTFHIQGVSNKWNWPVGEIEDERKVFQISGKRRNSQVNDEEVRKSTLESWNRNNINCWKLSAQGKDFYEIKYRWKRKLWFNIHKKWYKSVHRRHLCLETELDLSEYLILKHWQTMDINKQMRYEKMSCCFSIFTLFKLRLCYICLFSQILIKRL